MIISVFFCLILDMFFYFLNLINEIFWFVLGFYIMYVNVWRYMLYVNIILILGYCFVYIKKIIIEDFFYFWCYMYVLKGF